MLSVKPRLNISFSPGGRAGLSNVFTGLYALAQLVLIKFAVDADARGRVATPLIAASILLGLIADDQFLSSPFYFHWCALGIAFAIGPKRYPGTFVATAGISLICFAGITAASLWWHDAPRWSIAAIIFIWMIPLTSYLFLRLDESLWKWLSIGGIVIAVSMWWQGILGNEARLSGLVENPNHAAGLMLVLAIYWMTGKRHKYLGVPFVYAMAFTGSRMAIIALAIVLFLHLARNRSHFRRYIAQVILPLLPVLLLLPTLSPLYSRPDAPIVNAVARVVPDAPLDFSGHGFGNGLSHNTPVRLVQEFGLPSLIIWLSVVVLAIVKGKSSPRLYIFAAVLLVLQLDSYFWIGPLGALFWILFPDLSSTKAPPEPVGMSIHHEMSRQ